MSLLHDAGMMEEVAGEDFTVRSGMRLIDVAERAGRDDGVGRRMADAAVAHASPGLDPTHDDIGYYVQVGATTDLAGQRMADLPKGHLARAYEAHPGEGVNAEIRRHIATESRNVPDGRFALLDSLGFRFLVGISPTRRLDRGVSSE